jgi:NAD(P)-dependent dehydrogenase (short-subunit alcohol dehydrogenase family)
MSSTKDVIENHVRRFREGNLESPSPCKVAIVTGASSGIGLEMVKRLIEKGYRVIANSRNVTSAMTLQSTADLKLVDGDIGIEETAKHVVRTAIQSFGTVDLLGNVIEMHEQAAQKTKELSC